MQAETSGNFYAFNATTSFSVYFDNSVPKDDLISFFSFDGHDYILQKTQLILLYYYPSTTTYSYSYTLSTFPVNNFVQTFGTVFDLLFIPFTSNVYKSSRCSTQEWFDGTSCVAFTCSDPNCAVCANIPSVCTNCGASFTLASDGSCSSPANSNSTSNSTTNTNQTNTGTTNSTEGSNSANSTNSANFTNSTNSTTSANSTSLSNNTFPLFPFNPFSNNGSFNLFLSFL